MKQTGKIVALMLALCLLLSLRVAALSRTFETNTNTDEVIVRQIEALWASAENKVSLRSPRSAVSTQAYLGTRIPAYEATTDGLETMSYLYYPIIKDSRIVALSITDIWNDDEVFSTLTFDFIDELQSVYEEGNSVAFVYTREGLYLCTETENTLICENTTSNMNRVNLTNIAPEEEIVDYLTLGELNISTQLQESSATTRAATSKECNVDIIEQSGDNTCWAASTVSIGEYITGLGLYSTGEQLSRDMNGSTYDVHGSWSTARDALYNYYDIWGTYYDIYSISSGTILSDLKAGRPLYGSFYLQSNTSQTHASVIRGINTSSKTFSVMDPQAESYTYGSYAVRTNYTTYSFVAIASGETLILVEGLRTYEDD